MSFVREFEGGEKGVVDEPRRRIKDVELLQLRAGQMLTQRIAGWKTVEIARYFGISRQLVNREIAAIPPKVRRIIEARYRRGESFVA